MQLCGCIHIIARAHFAILFTAPDEADVFATLIAVRLPATPLRFPPPAETAVDAAIDDVVGVARRCLMRVCSVDKRPLSTSWLGIFFAKRRRLTESSYVNRATMFCSRNP